MVITLTDRPELANLVTRWRAAGAMEFKWPADNEELWQKVYWHYHLPFPKESILQEIAGESGVRHPSDITSSVESIGSEQIGPAVNAVLDYWDTTPRRTAETIVRAYDRIASLAAGSCDEIYEYKRTVLDMLEVLKESLDDNERGWRVWRFFTDRGGEEEDRNARELIRGFDKEVGALRETIENNVDKRVKVAALIRETLEQIAKPIPKGLGFDT